MSGTILLVINVLKYTSLSVVLVFISFPVESREEPIELKCTDTGDLCAPNRTCEFICRYPCCNKSRNIILVRGSTIYSSDSSICRAALHDLRISLHNSSSRNVKIKRFQEFNCSLISSVRYGFASSSFQNETCNLFKFITPRITGVELDIVSMHSNYLHGQNETHTQTCATASNALDQDMTFGVYSEWISCNRDITPAGTQYEGVKLYKNIWSEKHFAPGFQCIPTETDLSIITSIAFRRDAFFLPEFLTITANKYENITLTMNETKEMLHQETIWRKDDKVVHETDGARTELYLSDLRESASGIYSLTYENTSIEEAGYVRLIVRACPTDKFGDNCFLTCPTCVNGGICHDITGECICAPGFNGSSCEQACEPGFIGKMCNIKCAGHFSGDDSCKKLLMCLPSPYGCSCASGFSGLHCDNECPGGFYGAGCHQRHKHIHFKDGTCSRFSNYCECQSGWHGTYCNESFPVLDAAPSLFSVTENTITLSFNGWSNDTDSGSGTPAWYEVVFKEPDDDSWTLVLDVPEKSEILTYEVQIYDLKPATQYIVGIIVVDESGNKQEEGIKTVDACTDCDIPSTPPTDIVLSSANQHIYVHWKIPPRDTWNCWEINITVIAKEVSTNHSAECIKSDNFSCSFFSNHLDTWVIEVCASTDKTKQNCTKPENITSERPAHMSPVELEIIKLETSVYISWLSSRFSHKFSHYAINYEDVDMKTSNSIEVQTQDVICDGNNENYNCYTIENLNPGHTYTIEIIGFIKDVNEGILINSFIVRLESTSDALPVILGVCMPIVIVLIISILIICLQTRKRRKTSIRVKFLPNKLDSEFASCNEALDEMEIIETESMCEEISNVIPLGELLQYVKQSLQNVKIRKEFMSVPTGQIYPCSFAKLGENKPKNRYGNILPYDHSRVILDTVNDDPFSNYIHASYIHGYDKVKKYIATQGPLPNTVNDFWRMVWNENSCKILMITNFVENGKYKCEKYWSESSGTYGDIEVSCRDSNSNADFIIRTFDIVKDKSAREVKQFHFTTWPDHGAPPNPTSFIHYLKKSRIYRPDSETPIIIHCSAGIGRTGATILLDSMMDMGFQEKKVDTVNQLCSMRKQRMNIVENYDQYVFVYYALAESLCFEDTCLKKSAFKKEYGKMKGIDKTKGITFIESQFKALESLNIQLMSKDVLGAYQMENQSKNRSMYILPPDRGRPSLSRDSTGYINAVYVDSFTTKNAFIATQYPLPETARDFWSMVYQQKSNIIVVLQEMDYSIEETPQLWLPMDIQTFGEFEICCDVVTTQQELSIARVNLSTTEENNKESVPINILILKNWSLENNLPEMSTILSAISEIHSLNSETKSTVTTVCLDGATACGLFCASLYVCDQVRAEAEVDIFRAVKCIRTNRQHFIPNLAQYEFLFDVVSSYLNTEV